MILERAILETLAYSDVFDFPLTLDELHRYLVTPASKDEISQTLKNMNAIDARDVYYFLAGRQELVDLRKVREAASRKAFRRAELYGRFLSKLPFVRMVAVTGSLAVMNLSTNADLDYMLITQPGRLWIARAFAVTFGRIMRPFGYTICVNLLISENSIEWQAHDLYSAREICQMIPVVGLDVYQKLRVANSWTQSILPNAGLSSPLNENQFQQKKKNRFQSWIEMPLRGKLGDWIEKQLQKFQMGYITHRFGKGNEANFSADLCQGNFHDHHQKTDALFHQRLISLGLEEPAEELTISVIASL